MNRPPVPPRSGRTDIEQFLEVARRVPAPADVRGRLVFALDATASRERSWQRAMTLQQQMFEVAADQGGIAIQICHYGGQGDFHVLPWVRRSQDLRGLMNDVRCCAGPTQIHRVLRHVDEEATRQRMGVLIFVGDALEEDETELLRVAGRLALRGVRAFMFQEGSDPRVARTFGAIARLTRGVHAAFDGRSATRLRELLEAAAAYAAGGEEALLRLATRSSTGAELLRQLTAGP